MSIQYNTAENYIPAKEKHGEQSSIGIITSNTLADAWLNSNRDAVEDNTFFSLGEPDATVEATPELKRHQWMHRQPITH